MDRIWLRYATPIGPMLIYIPNQFVDISKSDFDDAKRCWASFRASRPKLSANLTLVVDLSKTTMEFFQHPYACM